MTVRQLDQPLEASDEDLAEVAHSLDTCGCAACLEVLDERMEMSRL